MRTRCAVTTEMLLKGLLLLLASALPCAGQAALLDGRVIVAGSTGLNPSGNFTLEAWIRPTVFHFNGNTDSSYQTIIYKWIGSTGNERSWLLDIYQDQLEFAITASGDYGNSAGVYSNTRLALNQWTHVAGVFDAGTLSLFINGVKDTATATLAGTAFPGDASILIGGATGATYQRFHGGIDEVRISDAARYSSNFSAPAGEFAPDSHTMLLMHFNEGTGVFTDNVGLLGGDGTLDSFSRWGEGATFAPEPASVSLLALGGLLMARRRRA